MSLYDHCDLEAKGIIMRNLFLICSAVCALAPLPAQALTTTSYDVRHGFYVWPSFGSWGWYWRPVVTRWGFSVGPTWARNSIGQLDYKVGVAGNGPLPLGGGTFSVTQTAAVTWASAQSLASASVSLNSAGTLIGTIRAAGFASVNPPAGQWAQASARSSAWARSWMYGVGPWGWLWWPSFSFTSVSGSAFAQEWNRPIMRDPIDFSALNLLTGERLSGRMLQIDYGLRGGDGDLNWDSGVLQITGPSSSGFFALSMPSSYTTLKGTIELEWENGIFTKSLGTGDWSGVAWLPMVGDPALGNFGLVDPQFQYDFGWDPDTPVSLRFRFGNGGMTTDIPEPATWAMLVAGFGLVGGTLRRRRRLLPVT